ncbi:MAG: cytochrome c oxidase subunit I [Melioribacteraceae bacterium]|nr:cytochrome c oxidase subunit I [Melioribacteraceae bacterium]MCF8264013.1 cytochrome c oxidase subunit I [Melioribacteraceae bacterium]MCF8412697.1 cytochrome c oxidase subunit I [Melioribacteraceae bacterium]MCF8431784.1 cytochrome c oxidase subunit I [Melioribacteraceae bacterium]
MANGTIAEHAKSFYEEGTSKKTGLLGWFFSTDHKRIGIMYLAALSTFFIIGVILALFMRLELIAPGETLMDAQTYNTIFTLHGVIMIFLFIVPGIPAIFGNFFLPLMLGAKDVSFPRLNLLSFWIYIVGAILVVISLFVPGGPIDTGWTFYIPYSVRTGTNVSLAIFAAFVLGFSSILTGLNFITTVHRLKAPGMGFFKMPLFVWSTYATAWIQVLATPVIGITILLVIMERAFGIGIFDPSLGGDPILYQHLFWIYSHPAVYIMILPAMGIVSEIIPTFARRTIFGYNAIALSSLAIAFVGYLVWAHHMFTSGMSDTARIVFSFLTFIVALPSGVKVFNWVATMYKGSIDPQPPFLWVMAFIVLFSIGGLTGLVLGSLATDIHLHDTYFVVAHFHYVMFGGTGTIFFAGLYYWFPKMFGKLYHTKLANIGVALFFVAFNLLYFPKFIMGYQGMPRRYYDYLPEFADLQLVSTIGSWLMAIALIIVFGNLIRSLRTGRKATSNPWGGVTLEWHTTSPPPLENFETDIVVTHDPYDFSQLEDMKNE